MNKEKFIEELSKELCMSKNMLTEYITIVGTNKENIKDYAENSSFAIVRKDNDFNVDYTAVMLNNKDIAIKQLQQENEQLKKELTEKDEIIFELGARCKTFINEKYEVEIRNLQVDKAELKLEIEKLKDKLKRTEKAMHEEVKEHLNTIVDLNQLRHEICEKIRKKLEIIVWDDAESVYYEIREFLHQIERGDEE